MYNRFGIFDDCAVYIDEEKGFVKLVKNDTGLVASKLDNTVQSLEKEISIKKEQMNLLNKKKILKQIKNLESHLNFFKERFNEEEAKLETDYVFLQDISKIGDSIKEEQLVNNQKVKKL